MTRNKVAIYLAADSTVRDYDSTQFPQAGWGQFIADYLTDDVVIKNHAVGGRSSKTFITEGRLAKIAEEISANDYLFIQMGHNDSTKDRPERYTEPYGSYKFYLQQYINAAKAKNAIPVLITPVGRLHYVNGEFLMDFKDYCNAMKELAKENDVFLIDLMERSIAYLSSIGYENAKELYMISVNGTDCTHFTEKGANEMAKLVSEGMIESARLAMYVK
ncbi:rhamnogalacturonan acetylesterase [Sporosarcina jiandibaonis]|uniref:rhamnogalacturonan acetylesterase n=1 Tax=Sporosarcina jiandibaonis TaxID=2715535 RepID=UPI0015553941|nr:rhamnogalacturonan acetylesterase [Sporosarcina jiandibaonis]